MFTHKDVIDLLEKMEIRYKLSGSCSCEFNTFCSLNEAKEHAITWIKNLEPGVVNSLEKYDQLLVLASIDQYDATLTNIIYVENLKGTFFQVLKELFQDQDIENNRAGIEKSAIVLTKQIGEDVYIGHHSFVDEHVVIGNNVKIMHNVVIQGDVVIGDDSFIESGVLIGVCGYGLYNDKDDHPTVITHLKGVKIGKGVRIGAGTCIARGCLCDTEILDYVKIDNLCHIAHNVKIGENTKVIACAEISGSVEIGKNSYIAPCSSIINGAKLGEGTFIGMHSNVLKNVPAGMTVYGNPGKLKN